MDGGAGDDGGGAVCPETGLDQTALGAGVPLERFHTPGGPTLFPAQVDDIHPRLRRIFNLRETVRGSNTPMALVNVSLCKSLYDDYAETLDGLFQAVKDAVSLPDSAEPACMAYGRTYPHSRSVSGRR